MSARKKRRAEEKRPEPAEDESSGERSASRSFWSGTITFGLVSIPVDFHAAHRPRRASLRMVTDDGHPVGKRYICPRHERPIADDEVVRGFEREPGEFVVLTDEELEAAAPEKTRDIDLLQFVPRSSLPSLLFRRAYVLAPAGGSTKAYHLLAETMERTDRAGIATFVMRDKAYVVAILAAGGVLRAETLRFSGELRTPASVGLPEPVRVPAEILREALQAIDALVEDELDLEELRDEASEALSELAQTKAQRGEDIVVGEAETEDEVPPVAPIDLVALLKQRLEHAGLISDQHAAKAQRPPRRDVEEPELAKKAKNELYERAKTLGIQGRSRMSKRDLVVALKKATG